MTNPKEGEDTTKPEEDGGATAVISGSERLEPLKLNSLPPGTEQTDPV